MNSEINNYYNKIIGETSNFNKKYYYAKKISSLIKADGEKAAEELAYSMYDELGKGVINDIWIYSFIIKINPLEKWLKELLILVIDSKELNWQNKYFIFYQVGHMVFMEPKLNTKEVQILNWKLLDQTKRLLIREIRLPIRRLNDAELNNDYAVVIIEQYLTEQHGPTKTVLDRCSVLQKKLNKKILIINTAELMPSVGVIPFFDAAFGSYIENYLNVNSVEWNGREFSFYQCINDMPNIDEIENLIQAVLRIKPSTVLLVGGSSLLAGIINEYIPVLTVGTTFSGLATTLTDYQIMPENKLLGCEKILKEVGRDMNSIIKGRFTFSLKEQTEMHTRQEYGINDSDFVIALIGARLEDEITDELWNMFSRIVDSHIKIILIGPYGCYEEKMEKHSKLNEHVINLGFCNDVLSIVELCDIYVNPYRRGGGTSAVEAMVKGKPVVTMDYGDVTSVVDDRFICSSYDEMADIIMRYYNDKKYYDYQSKNAIELANKCLDSDTEFVRIINEYNDRIKQIEI